MSELRERRELLQLLEELCNGRLDPPSHDRLQRLLISDPEAQRIYLDYVDMHLALSRLGRAEAVPVRPIAAASNPDHRNRTRFPGGWLTAAAAVAAALLLALGAGLTLRPRPEAAGRGNGLVAEAKRPGTAAGVANGPRSATGLAMVVKLDAVRWGGADRTRLSEGQIVAAGRVQLEAGCATLAFLNGVMLTLEGPADLELVSIERVFCHRGRLRVRVPDGAEGFVVAAPGSSVVDLGTEFALNVGDDGKARVMVFEGEAEAAVLGTTETSESSQSQLLEQSTAVEIDPRSGQIKSTVADQRNFLESPRIVTPPLVLDPGYSDAILKAQPWGYWRFESLDAGATPNAIDGRPSLRAVGAVGISAAAAGNRSAVFAASGGVKYLEMEGRWEPPREPGYAIELWALSEQYNYSTLVALLAPMDERTSGHFSLVELLACGRYPFPRSASVRLLHRWPPGGKGGISLQNGITYQLYRWHHLVAQVHGDRMELYIDGVLTRSQPLGSDRSTTPCGMLVGRLLTTHQNAPEKNRPLVGRVDELALYDHPLSAEQVWSHYQLATPEGRQR